MNKANSQRREDEKFVVRLPIGMRGRIAEKAKSNLRSMNNEIIYRLEKAEKLEAENARLWLLVDKCMLAQSPDATDAPGV